MFKTFDKNNSMSVYIAQKENKKLLKPISMHDMLLDDYATILTHYPMPQSKYEIYLKLDKKKRVGMLNRYILGIASKLGIYQSYLREINELRKDYRKYKKFSKNERKPIFLKIMDNNDDNYWKKSLEECQLNLTKHYKMLFLMMFEEIVKRNNPKYLRRKKLEKINNTSD